MYIIKIVEKTNQKPVSQLEIGEEANLNLFPEIERLSMTVDGPIDIPAIIATIHRKPRARRSDAGTKRAPKQD